MIERAKELLETGGHACVLMRDDFVLTSDSRGVKQLLNWDLAGAYIADKVIGKAAASIMICGGVRGVYAAVISSSAIALFTEYGVEFTYGEVVEFIQNRDGTDMCPMEKLCLELTSAEECSEAIRRKICQV